MRWRLDSPRVRRALDRRPVPAWSGRDGLALVADYERLRVDAPAEARALRAASVAAFTAAAREGLRPELDAAGDYVFTADDPDRDPDDQRPTEAP